MSLCVRGVLDRWGKQGDQGLGQVAPGLGVEVYGWGWLGFHSGSLAEYRKMVKIIGQRATNDLSDSRFALSTRLSICVFCVLCGSIALLDSRPTFPLR